MVFEEMTLNESVLLHKIEALEDALTDLIKENEHSITGNDIKRVLVKHGIIKID